jgi:hypothetical protein
MLNLDKSGIPGRVARYYKQVFAYQKSQVGNILEGLRMENVGRFYTHLVFYVNLV